MFYNNSTNTKNVSINRRITFDLNASNTKKKTKAYANGNPDPSLGQIRSCEGVKPFNLI